jgi:hypothetical protein
MIALALAGILAAATLHAEEEFGYYVLLSWVGDADMDLILRHPDEADSQNDTAPRDCYYGQENPDWGVPNFSGDNPRWLASKDGETNIEAIVSVDLFDVGTYVVIARAFSGAADCRIEVSRWRGETSGSVHEKHLTTDTLAGSREARWQYESLYVNMGTRVIKFKQHKKGKEEGKFVLKMDFATLGEEITTNEDTRVYLNDENVYNKAGDLWRSNDKKTKFRIDKPWTCRVIYKGKNRIYLKGRATQIFKSMNVLCNYLIGEYLGTNSFRTTKKCVYKYKEKQELGLK